VGLGLGRALGLGASKRRKYIPDFQVPRCGKEVLGIPTTQNDPIVDQKQRTAAAATAFAKASRQPVDGPI
jgi:hypothetical protein